MKRSILKYHLMIMAVFNLNNISIGQAIVDSTDKHPVYLMGGIQVFDHTNGGPFLLTNYPDDLNTAIDEILVLPMLSVSFGLKFKNIVQMVDFSYKKRKGFYDMGQGRDYINLKYFSYHVWYDFMTKSKFPIKPLISFSSSFVIKNYYFFRPTDYSGGSDREYKDNSNSISFQLPLGMYFKYKKLLMAISYNFNLLAQIKGNYEYNVASYWSWVITSTSSESLNYSGNSSESDFKKQRNLFSLRICYNFNLDKK